MNAAKTPSRFHVVRSYREGNEALSRVRTPYADALVPRHIWAHQRALQFLMESLLPSTLASAAVLAIIMVIAFERVFGFVGGWAWLFFAASGIAGHLVYYFVYRKQPERFSKNQWLVAFRMLTFVSGLSYGLLAFVFFEQGSLALQAFIALVMIAAPAVAIGTLAADRPSYLLYISAITPLSVAFFISTGEPDFWAIAALVVLATAVLSQTAIMAGKFIGLNIDMAYSMKYRAAFDPLVPLFNRAELEAQYEQKVPITQGAMAMLFIDLDDFKAINDTYGHEVGDEALLAVAHAIKDSVRHKDIPARLGGDEFAVVLFVDHPDEAIQVGQQVINRIRKAKIATLPMVLGASVGVGYHPNNDVGYSGLMRAADMALYQSKANGKHQVSLQSVQHQFPTES